MIKGVAQAMAYERRGLNRYYYRKKRINGRVISEYIGAGLYADMVHTLDIEERELLQAERVKRQQERARTLQAEKDLNNSLESINKMIETALINAGYHKVVGTWRKKRTQN